MAKLEEIRPNAALRGILADSVVMVVNVQWYGSAALELTYKTATGKVANELLYRHDEPRLEIVEEGRPWSFDGDGAWFRLVSEAHRIRLAHLFDPVLAVHTSMVEPLPHQITAVYDSMLARQPLRFLLADDPGAGKTIMAGLLMKELIARGDLQRCLVVCPGSLAEQWQDELYMRFHLPFDILTNDKLEAARTGNWFLGTSRVPHLSRFFERWVRAVVIRLSLVKEVTLIFNYLDSPITTLACDRRPDDISYKSNHVSKIFSLRYSKRQLTPVFHGFRLQVF